MMIIVTFVSWRMETNKGLEVSSCKQLEVFSRITRHKDPGSRYQDGSDNSFVKEYKIL
jgi:hypothetical protein